jgi:hypothetical protein
MEHRRAVGELCGNDRFWGGPEVMSNKLTVVVEDVGVLTGIHGEAMIVNEGFIWPWRGTFKLVDGGLNRARGR